MAHTVCSLGEISHLLQHFPQPFPSSLLPTPSRSVTDIVTHVMKITSWGSRDEKIKPPVDSVNKRWRDKCQKYFLCWIWFPGHVRAMLEGQLSLMDRCLCSLCSATASLSLSLHLLKQAELLIFAHFQVFLLPQSFLQLLIRLGFSPAFLLPQFHQQVTALTGW